MLQFYPVVLVLASHLVDSSFAQHKSPVSARIWNGFATTDVRDFPYYAGILHRDELSKKTDLLPIKCGGTIVDELWVVTAASCVEKDWDAEIQLADGWVTLYDVVIATNAVDENLYELSMDARSIHIRTVGEIVIHPEYIGDEDGRKHDIAMLRLLKPLSFAVGVVQPASLPLNIHHEIIHARQADVYYIVGFGIVRPYEGPSNRLKGSTMRVKSGRWCESSYTMTFFRGRKRQVTLFDDEEQICADGNSSHVCRGDIGGGLVGLPYRTKADFAKSPPKLGVLVGVLSWTPTFMGCGLAFPSIYTRITMEKVEWMQELIRYSRKDFMWG